MLITHEQIEAAARRICEARCIDPNALVMEEPLLRMATKNLIYLPPHDRIVPAWHHFRNDAASAIAAYRKLKGEE